MSRRRSALLRNTAISAVAGATLLMVAASPAILQLLGHQNLDWSRLGDVGQAYGAASALLSSAAVLVVAVSLVVQQRQTHIMQRRATLDRQFELAKMTLQNPKFLKSWGFDAADGDQDLKIFSNLIVSYWYMLWAIGAIVEPDLRTNLRRFFGESINRDYWSTNSSTWLDPSARTRRFVAILDSECAAIAAHKSKDSSTPPATDPPTPSTESVSG